MPDLTEQLRALVAKWRPYEMHGQEWDAGYNRALETCAADLSGLLAAAEGVERDAWLGAFVQGAKWWEWHKTGATMWQSDQALAHEQAQVKHAAMRDSGEGR